MLPFLEAIGAGFGERLAYNHNNRIVTRIDCFLGLGRKAGPLYTTTAEWRRSCPASLPSLATVVPAWYATRNIVRRISVFPVVVIVVAIVVISKNSRFGKITRQRINNKIAKHCATAVSNTISSSYRAGPDDRD